MTVDAIRKLQTSSPFRRFQIRTANGERFDVGRPEMMAIAPTGDLVIVWSEKGGFNLIDAAGIADVAVAPKRR